MLLLCRVEISRLLQVEVLTETNRQWLMVYLAELIASIILAALD